MKTMRGNNFKYVYFDNEKNYQNKSKKKKILEMIKSFSFTLKT
jgi:hypothetical protein